MDLINAARRLWHTFTRVNKWEAEEDFRQIILRLNRRGLVIVSLIGIVCTGAYVLGSVLVVGKDVSWTIGDTEPNRVILWGDKLFSISLFLLMIFASRTEFGVRWARLLISFTGLVAGFSWLLDDVAHRDMSHSAGFLGLILTAIAGVMPLRPAHTILLSVSMLGVFVITTSFLAYPLNQYEPSLQTGHYFLLTLIGIMLSGISAFIYSSRYQIYRISKFSRILTERSTRQRDRLARLNLQLTDYNLFIRQVFGRYLSHEVVQKLLETPEGLKVGGTRRVVTILISDIRGFSSLSESLPPERVMEILNSYLEAMTGVIQKYGGTIDEFIGDAIFVIFGAPEERDDDATRAVACAIAMQIEAERLNARYLAHGDHPIEVGIGIATGEVVVGNMGSLKRAKYGAVGRSVNLAARVESYTVGGQILVTDETLQAVGSSAVVGNQFLVEPKGARKPISVHEIIGLGGKYQLVIPLPGKQLHALHPQVPFNYVVLEEKFVGRTLHSGHVVALSDSEADVVCMDRIPLLSNLKLYFLDNGQTVPGEVYGKIIGQIDRGNLYRLRFTSVSIDARAYLEQLKLANSGMMA